MTTKFGCTCGSHYRTIYRRGPAPKHQFVAVGKFCFKCWQWFDNLGPEAQAALTHQQEIKDGQYELPTI